MKLKYCGLTTPKDVETAVSLGVDYIGFVLYPPSVRYIAPEKLEELLQKSAETLKKSTTKTVVVCVNYPAKDLAFWVKKWKIDILQLHGEETQEDVDALHETLRQTGVNSIKIFKALRLEKGIKKEEISALMQSFDEKVEAFVVEALHKDYGGTGKSLEKEVVANIFCVADQQKKKIFLSGGVSAEKWPDIQKKFAQHPSFVGIDMSSALETEKGVKSVEKMRDFYQIFTKNR